MGLYKDADKWITDVGLGGAKVQRGFGSFYDVVTANIENPQAVLEIGIGLAHPQIAWSLCYPEARVIGIDVATPHIQSCAENNIDVAQMLNVQNGFNTLFGGRIPLSIIKQLCLIYNHSGYDKDVAQMVVDSFGKLPLIVNDGWQVAQVHNLLLDAWKDAVTDDGIIVQEKIGRMQFRGVCVQQMQKALTKGWRIFDVRKEEVNGLAESDGYIAVWYKNKEKWDDKFSDFIEVTDPESYVPKEHQIPEY